MSDVEADLHIDCHAVTWPIHQDGAFVGVYDRRQRQIHLFDRGELSKYLTEGELTDFDGSVTEGAGK